jgi:PAS domain S-box-containing protein
MAQTSISESMVMPEQKEQIIPLSSFFIRLIWWCILPIVLLSLFLAIQHISSLKKLGDQTAEYQARNVAFAIDNHIKGHIAALEVMAASSLATDPAHWHEFYNEAQSFHRSFGGHVVLADLSMQMRFNTRVPFGADLPQLPKPKGHSAVSAVLETGKPSVGDMFLGPVAKEPLIALVVPITRNGQMQFLLLNIIETRQLQQRLDETALPSEWSLAVLDSKNEVMARRSPPGVEFRPIAENVSKRWTVNFSHAPWSVVLDIPSDAYRKPFIIAAIAMVSAIAIATLIGVCAGRLAGRRLTGSLANLIDSSSVPTTHPIIEEIETVRCILDRAAAARQEAESTLRESEHQFRLVVENAPDSIFIQTEGQFVYLNRAAADLFGAHQPSELIGMPVIDRVHPDFHQITIARIHQLNLEKKIVPRLSGLQYLRLDNTPVTVETSAVPFEHGGKDGALVFVRDLTESVQAQVRQKDLEGQLNQAQKMEAVGRLAGGVAHDYNNMLSVIVGYSELALEEVAADDPLYECIQAIHEAAIRSVSITRQLLAFARKQTIAPVVLDLNKTVESMLGMLRRLIGEDLDLAWRPRPNIWPVKMDPSQVDQMLANLCVNARDALNGVGHVTIETGAATFDEAYCTDHVGFIPGDYVLLAVSDDGCGMDRETVGKIFEPFYTTKGIGQGTGLGLSTVYGIVKQNAGFINVYSEPGKGTTFKIYLARHANSAVESPKVDTAKITHGHGETILIVEDEVSILELAKRILEGLGYTVMIARLPSQALNLAEEHLGEIHLLITDVVMPEMNGRELSTRLRTRCPTLRTLFMSGYTANVIAHRGVLDEGVQFMPKPFSKESLAQKVRDALNS